jgi:hypothetical protein
MLRIWKDCLPWVRHEYCLEVTGIAFAAVVRSLGRRVAVGDMEICECGDGVSGPPNSPGRSCTRMLPFPTHVRTQLVLRHRHSPEPSAPYFALATSGSIQGTSNAVCKPRRISTITTASESSDRCLRRGCAASSGTDGVCSNEARSEDLQEASSFGLDVKDAVHYPCQPYVWWWLRDYIDHAESCYPATSRSPGHPPYSDTTARNATSHGIPPCLSHGFLALRLLADDRPRGITSVFSCTRQDGRFATLHSCLLSHPRNGLPLLKILQ